MSPSIEAYFSKIDRILSKYFALVEQVSIQYEKLTPSSGYIKGRITIRNTELFFFEYLKIRKRKLVKEKYRYHWQTIDGDLIKRWDNAPHHKGISTFPYHIDTKKGVQPSKEVYLEYVLSKIIEEL